MNGVSLSNKVIYWNPKDFAVSQNFNKVIRENEKVSNDYYWKSNKLRAWTASEVIHTVSV